MATTQEPEQAKGRAPNLRSSIYYSESDGRWHGWVTMGLKPNGAPDRRHRMAKTEAEVTAKVQKLEEERAAGTGGQAGERPTVAQWMDTYLTTIAPKSVSPDTLANNYEPKVRRWIIPGLGQHRLHALQAEHVDEFDNWLVKQGLAPNSILKIHQVLMRALRIAYKRGKMRRDLSTLVDPPTGEDTEIEPLTIEEAQRLIDASSEIHNGARWSVALAVGVRQAEALGLRWQHVDLEQGVITVGWQLKRDRYRHGCADVAACTANRHRRVCPKKCPKAARKSGRRHTCITNDDPKLCPKACTGHAVQCPRRTGGTWRFALRKGVKPGRGMKKLELPLPETLVEQLRRHRVSQNAERLAAGEWWEDWDLVFCRPDGRPIDRRDDYEDWRSLLTAAGVREARVHDARHTAATMLLAQGVDVRIVQQILGHSQLSQTMRYTHVSLTMAQEAAGRMQSALWPTATGTATGNEKRHLR